MVGNGGQGEQVAAKVPSCQGMITAYAIALDSSISNLAFYDPGGGILVRSHWPGWVQPY